MKSEFDNCLEPYMTGCLEVGLGSVDYAMEQAKSVALVAEKARLSAEKLKEEQEALEKAKAEALEKAKAEAEALEKAKAEAIEKAEAEALEKEAARRIADNEVQDDPGQSAADNPTELQQTETDHFDGDDDMYGSD